MITGFIINAFYILFYNILNIFPTGTLPTDISTGFTTIMTYIGDFSFVINIAVLLTCVVTVVGFEIVMIGVKISFWLIRLVRGN